MSRPTGRSTVHPGWAEGRNPEDRGWTLGVQRSWSRIRVICPSSEGLVHSVWQLNKFGLKSRSVREEERRFSKASGKTGIPCKLEASCSRHSGKTVSPMASEGDGSSFLVRANTARNSISPSDFVSSGGFFVLLRFTTQATWYPVLVRLWLEKFDAHH